jgi:hypothetical protein
MELARAKKVGDHVWAGVPCRGIVCDHRVFVQMRPKRLDQSFVCHFCGVTRTR